MFTFMTEQRMDGIWYDFWNSSYMQKFDTFSLNRMENETEGNPHIPTHGLSVFGDSE